MIKGGGKVTLITGPEKRWSVLCWEKSLYLAKEKGAFEPVKWGREGFPGGRGNKSRRHFEKKKRGHERVNRRAQESRPGGRKFPLLGSSEKRMLFGLGGGAIQ